MELLILFFGVLVLWYFRMQTKPNRENKHLEIIKSDIISRAGSHDEAMALMQTARERLNNHPF